MLRRGRAGGPIWESGQRSVCVKEPSAHQHEIDASDYGWQGQFCWLNHSTLVSVHSKSFILAVKWSETLDIFPLISLHMPARLLFSSVTVSLILSSSTLCEVSWVWPSDHRADSFWNFPSNSFFSPSHFSHFSSLCLHSLFSLSTCSVLVMISVVRIFDLQKKKIK